MLRSKLILKIAGVNEESIKLCAIVEMIHAASLLHDDVIDEADTRRGQPSVNALYDNKTSIMFGDILYSRAFTELSQMDKRVAYTISNAVTLLSIGEMIDVDLTNSFNKSYDLYLDMIYKKTASLIEASAKAAAILAGLDENKYALYGKNLGVAVETIVVDRRDQICRDQLAAFAVAAFEQQAEFVAAQTRQCVGVTNAFDHQPRYLDQQVVACRMAAGVVDHLEMVEVQIAQGVYGSGVQRILKRVVDACFELTAVTQSGQRVVRRLPGTALQIFASGADVAQDDDAAGNSPIAVENRCGAFLDSDRGAVVTS